MVRKGVGSAKVQPPLGSRKREPSMATGSTGTCFCTATRKAPALKLPRLPSELRVPSGNRPTETPRSSQSPHSPRIDPAEKGFWRSAAM